MAIAIQRLVRNFELKFGCPEASHEQVVEVAKKARCHDLISLLPEGYNTMIGEGGSTLSGGEKQRISIARAMLKNAPVVLLDEATASVDPENEVYLQQAISTLVKDKTLIVIAHRLSTIRDAEQILVIDNGKLVQHGKHDELVLQEGIYQKYWNIRQNAKTPHFDFQQKSSDKQREYGHFLLLSMQNKNRMDATWKPRDCTQAHLF